MVKEFFQNEVNVLCDSTTSDVCGTRDQNIIDWTNKYTTKKNDYLQALKAWLESKIDSTASTNDSSLQTNVESAYNLLMIHLNKLSDYNNRVAESISTFVAFVKASASAAAVVCTAVNNWLINFIDVPAPLSPMYLTVVPII